MVRRLRPRRRLAATAVLIATGAATALPDPSAAAAPVTQVVPGRTMSAIVVDLDGDGSEELARIVYEENSPVMEVWSLSGSTWELHGRDAVPAPPDSAEVPQGGLTAALLSVDVAGEPILLLRRGAIDAASPIAAACCVADYEVRLRPTGIELVGLDGSIPAADVTYALDMDGDATDEIVTAHTVLASDTPDASSVTTVSVLRRVEGTWSVAFEQTRMDEQGVSVTAGESDGRPGMDLLLVPPDGLMVGRITMTDGEFQEEQSAMPTAGADGAWVSGVADRTLIVSESAGVSAVRWEAGASPVLVERLAPSEWAMVTTIGDGAEAVVLLGVAGDAFGVPTALEIRDPALRELGRTQSSGAAAALGELLHAASQSDAFVSDRPVWPFIGRIPGGWTDGRPAFAVGGTVIRPGGPDGFSVQSMATLLGTPLGLLGRDQEWVAVCNGCYGDAKVAYPVFGEPWGASELAFVPTADIESPGPEAVGADATYIGAELAGGANSGASTQLRGRHDGFEIVMDIPPRHSGLTFDGRSFEDLGAIDGQLRVEVRPARGRQATETFEQTVVLIGEDTRATVLRWQGTFLPEQPDLVARADVEVLSLSAMVSGTASPGSTVTVDGTPVEVGQDGAFAVRVDAPPWPRDVAVEARDGLGGERVSQVAVIGLVDYRGWPWVAIVGALVAVGAVMLFLRTPVHREPALAGAADDGVLEELDGDLA